MALLILASAAALITVQALAAQRAQQRARQALEARVLADTVLAETLAGLADDRYFGGVAEREEGFGTVSSAVSDAGRGRRLVEAVVEVSGRRVQVRSLVDPVVGAPRVLSWSRTTLRSTP